MSVNTKHAEYEASINEWTLTRDATEGSSAVKRKRTRYLPKPMPEDVSIENDYRYNDYLMRANFVNFTGATLDGMLGMVFRKPSVIELPQEIEYLIENSNGAGLTLDQMARSCVANVLQTGRHGLLVDYPQAEYGLTQAEIALLDLRANIISYPAETVLNWRVATIGGVRKLTLVVLAEKHEFYEGFETVTKEYYRVLSLEGGVYMQAVYDDDGNPVDQPITPRRADGSAWDFIPFVFVGAQNNDEKVDRAPLYDIAEVNLAHYRNSADFEESSFVVGQPTPVVSGLTQSWVDEILKGGVILGSRRAVLLPEGGDATLLQAGENIMPERGMVAKELQLVKLGARLITDAGGNETAEAAKIRYAGQNSKLATVVGNVEAALMTCFTWCQMFMGGAGEIVYTINKEFYDKTVNPQLVIARIQLLDRGVISKSVLQDKLRSEGEIDADITNEMINAEAESLI